MYPTQKNTAPVYPSYFLTGTNGTTGTALFGAGFSRPGSGTTPGQTGTGKPQRAATGKVFFTKPPAWPLFSGAKVASGQPLPANFSEQRTGKKIAMILTATPLTASGFGHRPVDNSPRFRGVVDNFSFGPVCVPAYLLINLCKSPEGLPGAACGQTGVKVMHNGHYA